MNNQPVKPPKRRLRHAALVLLTVMTIAVIAVVIIVPRSNKFQVDRQIGLSGPIDPITIVRDENGMPYIYAESIRDAIFGMMSTRRFNPSRQSY